MNDQQKFIHDNRKLRAMMDVTFTEIYAYVRSGDTTASEQSTFDARQNEVKENKKKLNRSGALKPFFDALHEADRQLMSAEGHLRRSREDRFKNDLAVAVTKLRECRRTIMAEKPKHSGKIRTMFDKLEVIMGNLETQARETHTAAEHKVVKDRDMQHVSAIREVVTALRTQVEDYVSSGEEQAWDVGELDRRDKSGKHSLSAQLRDFQTKVADTKTALSGRVNLATAKTLVSGYEADLREMVESAKQLDKNKSHFGDRLRSLLDSCEFLREAADAEARVLLKTNIQLIVPILRSLVRDLQRGEKNTAEFTLKQTMVDCNLLYNKTNALYTALGKYDSSKSDAQLQSQARKLVKKSKAIVKVLTDALPDCVPTEKRILENWITWFTKPGRSPSSSGTSMSDMWPQGYFEDTTNLVTGNKSGIDAELKNWKKDCRYFLDLVHRRQPGGPNEGDALGIPPTSISYRGSY